MADRTCANGHVVGNDQKFCPTCGVELPSHAEDVATTPARGRRSRGVLVAVGSALALIAAGSAYAFEQARQSKPDAAASPQARSDNEEAFLKALAAESSYFHDKSVHGILEAAHGMCGLLSDGLAPVQVVAQAQRSPSALPLVETEHLLHAAAEELCPEHSATVAEYKRTMGLPADQEQTLRAGIAAQCGVDAAALVISSYSPDNGDSSWTYTKNGVTHGIDAGGVVPGLPLRISCNGLAPAPSSAPSPGRTSGALTAGVSGCPRQPESAVGGEQAARCFYKAWTVGDRRLAEIYASDEAIAALFEHKYQPPAWQFKGCSDSGYCHWFIPDEGHGVRVEMALGETPPVGNYVESIEFQG